MAERYLVYTQKEDLSPEEKSFWKLEQQVDKIGRRLGRLNPEDSAQLRKLYQQLRLKTHLLYFPDVSCEELPKGQKLTDALDKEDNGTMEQDVSEPYTPLISLSEHCYQTVYLPLMTQLAKGESGFDAKRGTMTSFLVMKMLTVLGDQIVDNTQARAELWQEVPRNCSAMEAVPDCTDITQESCYKFLNNLEEQRRKLSALPIAQSMGLNRLIKQCDRIWKDVVSLAYSYFPSVSSIQAKIRRAAHGTADQDDRKERYILREDLMIVLLKVLDEARRLFHKGGTLYNFIVFRLSYRYADKLRIGPPQNMISLEELFAQGDPEVDGPKPAVSALKDNVPSAGKIAESQSAWYDLAAMILSFCHRAGREGQDFPYYRVLFTSDMMYILQQGTLRFAHERDLQRSMQFLFVNFCLHPQCHNLRDISYAQPKTYGEVLENPPETKRDKPLTLPTRSAVNAEYLSRFELKSKAKSTISDQFYKLKPSYEQLKYDTM